MRDMIGKLENEILQVVIKVYIDRLPVEICPGSTDPTVLAPVTLPL